MGEGLPHAPRRSPREKADRQPQPLTTYPAPQLSRVFNPNLRHVSIPGNTRDYPGMSLKYLHTRPPSAYQEDPLYLRAASHYGR